MNDTVLSRTGDAFLCARAPAGARSGAVRNPAMPLPVAEVGIAGLLQRSENRRNSVSPNDSPGIAKRIAESPHPRGFPRCNRPFLYGYVEQRPVFCYTDFGISLPPGPAEQTQNRIKRDSYGKSKMVKIPKCHS